MSRLTVGRPWPKPDLPRIVDIRVSSLGLVYEGSCLTFLFSESSMKPLGTRQNFRSIRRSQTVRAGCCSPVVLESSIRRDAVVKQAGSEGDCAQGRRARRRHLRSSPIGGPGYVGLKDRRQPTLSISGSTRRRLQAGVDDHHAGAEKREDEDRRDAASHQPPRPRTDTGHQEQAGVRARQRQDDHWSGHPDCDVQQIPREVDLDVRDGQESHRHRAGGPPGAGA